MSGYLWIPSIRIKGYRPFENTFIDFSHLQVIVGANGSGKSSVFEFLKFIRDACYHEIPPEIIEGAIGQQIFHKTGPDRLWWNLEIVFNEHSLLFYQGEILGPTGSARVTFERVGRKFHSSTENGEEYIYLDFQNGKGLVRDPKDKAFKRKEWDLKKPNQLGLGAITDSSLITLFNLREYIRGWRFYNSFHFNIERIRKSVPTSQEPTLNENASNLSAVLFHMMTEHPKSFEELKSVLKHAIPGFRDLNVKARGGPGEVIAFWQEKNIGTDLSLADLSDGTLRFLAWATLCLTPLPPSLICIDEPDQGVHPRTLPVLAGLLEKASQRTQVILATHTSYFLSQFDYPHIAVMKKEDGKSVYVKITDSKTLLDNLEDFGRDELEKMHRSDELEAFA